MKIVISPAKSLDYESPLPTERFAKPDFQEEAVTLNKALKELSPAELSKLMGISDNLANLNWERNQGFSLPFTPENSRQAIYAFKGDVYTGLDAYTIPADKLDRLEDSLRILSGLYGVLRPLDLMQPYRLEMGTSFGVNGSKNLYEFWREKVTARLNEELEDGEMFINLASNEYFKAVDKKALKVPVISPVFKDWKNEKLKVISFFAKKARGAMVRYIIDNDVQSLEDLKGFNWDGYRFSETYTQKESEPVFVR